MSGYQRVKNRSYGYKAGKKSIKEKGEPKEMGLEEPPIRDSSESREKGESSVQLLLKQKTRLVPS